nr:MAG TPA_asm: hypothetical protein [Caudoviricetes sp.]
MLILCYSPVIGDNFRFVKMREFHLVSRKAVSSERNPHSNDILISSI